MVLVIYHAIPLGSIRYKPSLTLSKVSNVCIFPIRIAVHALYSIFEVFMFFSDCLRHRWLHSMTDNPPTVEPPVPRKFLLDHTENYTASKKEYVPYSTVKPKIHSWQPNNK